MIGIYPLTEKTYYSHVIIDVIRKFLGRKLAGGAAVFSYLKSTLFIIIIIHEFTATNQIHIYHLMPLKYLV